MRNEPAVDIRADVGGGAARGIRIVVGDQVLERGCVPRLGGFFGRGDQRADLVLRRDGGAAAGDRGREQERRAGAPQAIRRAQDTPPTAATRP